MHCDSLGNRLTLQAASSLVPVNDFVEGFIACEARAVNLLVAAQTDLSCIVQSCAAALHMFAESGAAPGNARPFIGRAVAHAPQATPREQRWCAAVAAWVDGDIDRAIALHQEQALGDPRDLASVKLGQYHLFNRGDAPGMLRLALAALAAAADVPQAHGMAAFGWEQCHLFAQAEAAARHALALRQKEPWAQHALAHVLLGTGRIAEGLDFMRQASATWTGLNSFMRTHNWWHLALFALELDLHDEVLHLYDSQVWGVDKSYSQDQINAVSLLARLELAGVDVGGRWQDLANHLVLRLDDHVLPFLDMQYLYGLARADRPEARDLLAGVERMARSQNTLVRPDAGVVWGEVCLPACHGLLAHARGAYALAARALSGALPRLAEVGGSHAQRELFEQIHLDSLMRSGQWRAAQQLLQQRRNGQPESMRLKRQAGRVYAALGLAV